MQVGEAWVEISTKDNQLVKGLADAQSKTEKSMNAISAKMANVGKVMTIAGAAITAAFGLTVKAAMDFNKEMANIATLIPGSTKRVDELKSAIRDMAVTVGKDTTDLAQGAYQVISAWGDSADTVAILGIAAKAATAGVATTTDAIDLLSAVTKGYGDTSIEAVQKVSDLAFQTVTLGQTTFPELAGSIGKVTPLAAELGLGMDELFAVMATGTGVTGKAAEVSTQLRGVMQSLMAPTADMTKLLEEKGYASGKAMLADLGLAGSLDLIKSAAEASGEPLQKYISSIEGQTLALALTGTQADNYITKLAAMKESTGLTDIAFKEQTEGVNAAGFAFQQAKIQIAVFSQEIGDKLLPILVPLIQKFTEIVGKIRDWAEENKPLTETIVKWGAGIGALMLVLGPLLVILPSLITGVTMLSGAFLPFTIGGAIVLGMKKLSDYMGEIKVKAFEVATEFKDWPLDKLTTGISEVEKIISDLSVELAEAEKGFTLFGITLKNQDVNIERLKQVIKDYNIELGLLKEQRDKLIKAEKEGIDVTEAKIKLDKETKDLMDELTKKTTEQTKALEGKTKAAELANAQAEIENKLYELTLTPMENSKRLLGDLKKAYLDKGVAQGIVDKWHKLEIDKLKKVNKELDDNVDIMKKVKDITKAVSDKIYELTHLPYEVIIKGINEEYDDYIKVVKEAKLGTDEERKAIENINKARTIEIEKVDKTTEAEGKAIKQKEILKDAYKTLEDRIYELTHTAMENNIKKLEEQRLANIAMGVSITDADKLMKLEIETLGKLGNAFTNLQETVKPVITAITGYLENQLAYAISGLLGGIEDFEWTWSKFWEGLKNVLINAVAAMIAKLVVLAGFAWLLQLLGVPLWVLGMEKGGSVGYAKGGEVKEYQAGGGTDTVPAMLTPGEYIISKPMVDFIKRTGSVTGGLIDAIRTGVRTPMAFAGGGGISSSSYDNRKNYTSSINIMAGAIQIITPKFGEGDAQNMFNLIERQARNRGLKFATS